MSKNIYFFGTSKLELSDFQNIGRFSKMIKWDFGFLKTKHSAYF
ncbi:Protein CBG25512 [Caenorhabditis briggsae]|uniref:Protein CBG25512 n=1 Tax=Caenorhabditis briggsae TaxID=6238 RepID=B6IEQ2_CAEBR|nr:Protein CBG25512 [Caenorhabditis briggsae]CAR98382.1 Protein CBG25512 [Caenorhabditis briggsae]